MRSGSPAGIASPPDHTWRSVTHSAKRGCEATSWSTAGTVGRTVIRAAMTWSMRQEMSARARSSPMTRVAPCVSAVSVIPSAASN